MRIRLLIRLSGAIAAGLLFYGCGQMAAEMSVGEKLYRSKCSSCHNVIEPHRFEKERWREYIEKYGRKMVSDEKRMLLDYLAGSD